MDSRHKRPANRIFDVSFVVNDKGNIRGPISGLLWRESEQVNKKAVNC